MNLSKKSPVPGQVRLVMRPGHAPANSRIRVEDAKTGQMIGNVQSVRFEADIHSLQPKLVLVLVPAEVDVQVDGSHVSLLWSDLLPWSDKLRLLWRRFRGNKK